MHTDPATLAAVVEELQPLVGGRLQRIDLVAERELVLEVRCPGRTLRLLVSARPGAGRIHLIAERPPRALDGGELQRALRRRLEGRPLVALSIDRHTLELDARDAVLVVRLDGGKDALRFLPPSGRGVPTTSSPLPARFPRSEELAARSETRGPRLAADALRASLSKPLRARRAKLERLLAHLARDRERLEAHADGRRLGELLKPLLGQLARGASEVSTTDWATGAEVRVRLDPSLSPRANMERCFQRAKKAERGLPQVEARVRAAEAERAALEAELAELAVAPAERLVERAASRAEPGASDSGSEAHRASPRDPGPEARSPLDRCSRRFVALDGAEIRVGKGAAANDRLTFGAARGDDYWLHASGTSGAHVLLRVPKGTTPSREALLDAAHLAGHYSSAASGGKVEVTYTEARWVKKRKGDPPGRVSVSKAKTLLITLDPQRLDRLFGRTAAP